MHSMAKIVMYGAPWCGDCKRAKKFLGEQRVHYEWVDVDENPQAAELVEKLNDGKRIVPTIVFDDGSILVEPSNAELAAKLGLQTHAKLSYYDVIIVGSGPAGLTAALYTAREGLETLVIERRGVGGQAGVTERIDNFPGFPQGVSGAEFADRLAAQAERFGVEILKAQSVTGLSHEAESHYIHTGDGHDIGARAVLIATGSTYKRLHVPGEDDFIGAGVHFCATCDGPFYKGLPVAVVGGGNSAAEEGLFLTRFASHVTMLVRGDRLRASAFVANKIAETPGIDVRYNTEVTELRGERKLTGVTIHNSRSGADEALQVAGMFVFIGQTPNTQWLPPSIEKDETGFIITKPNLETSVPGVFAAGDARKGSTKQAASAAGEGATAAIMIRDYLHSR
jgi:thioredoxin reductase (NADPH)